MSKDQLEKSKVLADMIRKETRLPHNFPYELIDWLIEQAERVQELESEYKVRQVEYLEEHIDRLELQNKRYRELIKKMKRMVYDPDVDCGIICTEIIEMEE